MCEIEKAIDDLKNIAITYNDKGNLNYFKDTSRAINLAISVLEEKQVNRWIPCSERLPEINGHYTITYKDGMVGIFDKCGVNEPGCDVIAWQPLPQPYKED